MKRSGPEVEAAFRRERHRDFLADLKRGWWIVALLIGSLAFFVVNETTPRRSLGIEEAMVVGGKLWETDAGAFPYADLKLSNGSAQTVSLPRGVVLHNGARIRVEAFERSWPWGRVTYRYVGVVPNEQ